MYVFLIRTTGAIIITLLVYWYNPTAVCVPSVLPVGGRQAGGCGKTRPPLIIFLPSKNLKRYVHLKDIIYTSDNLHRDLGPKINIDAINVPI